MVLLILYLINCLALSDFRNLSFPFFTTATTQEECGAQMENQKAWQEHVEGHKAKLKAKIINSVR